MDQPRIVVIRISQISFILAIALHAFLLFGVVLPKTQHEVVKTETATPHVEVELVEAQPPVEEPPPLAEPEPLPEVVETPPPLPEPPKEVTQSPPPAPEPEPIRALPVTEPVVAAPTESEFQVAATTAPVVENASNVPLSPPVSEVPIVEAPEVVVKAEARYRHNPEPSYPLQAKRRRQEGLVLLRVILDKVGVPTKVEVKESSKFELLDKAAVDAVRLWQFEPAMFGDQPMASEVEVPVRFKLAR